MKCSETVAGNFNLTAVVDALFFIGSHLVALNRSGKLGVWHAMSQNWQVEFAFDEVFSITVVPF